jgi:hypothetical protein
MKARSAMWNRNHRSLFTSLVVAILMLLHSVLEAECESGWRKCYQCNGTGIEDHCSFANPYQEGYDSSKCRHTCRNCGGGGRVRCASAGPSNTLPPTFFSPSQPSGGVQAEKIRWRDDAIRYELALVGHVGDLVRASFDLYDLRTGKFLGRQEQWMQTALTLGGMKLSAKVYVSWDSIAARPHAHDVVLLFRMRPDGSVGFDFCNIRRCVPTVVR